MALAAGIAHLQQPVGRQLPLDQEIPVLVVEILAVTVDGLGAKELVLGIEEGNQRERQSREVGRGKRIARDSAFRRIAKVVVLIATEENAEARPDGSLRVQSPSQAQPRAEIMRVRRVIGGAF